jgi:aerobic carbon-monoxide dehydrogenase medium subunit
MLKHHLQTKGGSMKPAPFTYNRPESVAEAIKLLSTHKDDAKILAGGQSLVPMMNFRMARPEHLIDINRLDELNFHRVEKGELIIGALARHTTLRNSEVVRKACPLMADAYQHVSHGPIRNRGTLCGNLCHADPASEMPAVALVCDATLVLRSKKGERRVAAKDFFLGTYDTSTKSDELLTEVRIPVAPKGQVWSFQEVSIRKGDYAMAGVAVTLMIAAGKIKEAAIAVCGVGSRATRLASVEAMLVGAASDSKTIAMAADAAAAAVNPQSDVTAEPAHRRDLVRTLVSRTLTEAIGRAA